MPDPISCLSPSSTPIGCNEEAGDPSAVCSAPPQVPASAPPALMSVPPGSPGVTAPPSVTPAPSGVTSLIAAFSSSTAARPGPIFGGVPAHSLVFLGTTSGPSAAGGSHRDAAMVLKAQIDSGPLQGTGREVLSASKQFGTDMDLQVAVGRESYIAAHGGYALSVIGEAGAARANLGEHNDDGSQGLNVGLVAELAGVEATISTPIGSLTGGLSLSEGVSGFIGRRDADHDGKTEFCAKISIPAFTVGACVEKFW